MDLTCLCPDMECNLGYTWIPRQPLTKILCKTVLLCASLASCITIHVIWFVWHILGEPTTRFCRRQLLINRNIFSKFAMTDAAVHKPIPNIRDKSKFVCLQAC